MIKLSCAQSLRFELITPTDLEQGSQDEGHNKGEIHSCWSALVKTSSPSFGPLKSPVQLWSDAWRAKAQQRETDRYWGNNGPERREGGRRGGRGRQRLLRSYLLDWEVELISYLTLRNVFHCESCVRKGNTNRFVFWLRYAWAIL